MPLNPRIVQSILQKVLGSARRAAPEISRGLETSGLRAIRPFEKSNFLSSLTKEAGVEEPQLQALLDSGLSPADIRRIYMNEFFGRR